MVSAHQLLLKHSNCYKILSEKSAYKLSDLSIWFFLLEEFLASKTASKNNSLKQNFKNWVIKELKANQNLFTQMTSLIKMKM